LNVGLDGHKDSMAVAYAPEDRGRRRCRCYREPAMPHRQADRQAPGQGRM